MAVSWCGALLTLFLVPTALVIVPRLVPTLDPRYRDLNVHLWVVTGIAACALLVALSGAHSALRTRQHGPVWLSIGCFSVAFLMLGHGLMTPVVHDRPMNSWIGRLPYLALLFFAVCLMLAGIPRSFATSRLVARSPGLSLGGTALTLALFLLSLHRNPHRLHGATRIAHEETLGRIIGLFAALLLVVMAAVHWRRYRLGHDIVQLSLVFAAVMCTASIASLSLGTLWQLSWWEYHLFLLAGFGGAAFAVAVRAKRADASHQVLAAAFDPDAMTHIVDGYPDALRSLVRAVEMKDAYTAGHSQRTAHVAIQLGLSIDLDADMLRAAARGAYLHDVGKITIPDAILNKPGRLTPEERTIIETHPSSGYQLVLPVPELHEALPVVLYHHERWDGGGYPEGRTGLDIPLVARLVAVADVWDALTSDRSYRAGMSAETALGHIAAGRGTHFDPTLVDAFVALALDWGYRAASEGDADTAWNAAQTCHEVALTPNRA